MKILNGGYHKNQVICPDILYHLLHSWPSIHQISCKYSHVDQSYSNFEFSVAAILNKFNGAYYKNQVICPYIWYDLLYSWPSIHKIPCKYSHVDQSYSNFEFSVAAILKIQNGGRYSSQITCLHFLYDFNNKKLSIHKISCFYDNLNNQATNRSTITRGVNGFIVYSILETLYGVLAVLRPVSYTITVICCLCTSHIQQIILKNITAQKQM